jgi:chloramphenicol O-acetyltransferase
MAILPKAIYRFNAIPSKFQHDFQTFKEECSTSYAKTKQNKTEKQDSQTNLSNKRSSGGIPDLKLYYRGILI